MEFSWLSALFGAFGISLMKLLWDVAKYFIGRHDKKLVAEKKFKNRQSQIESLFNDLLVGSVGIQKLIENFQIDNNADRVLILRMENGGGVPQLGTAQHVSVLYEAFDPNSVEPVKTDFQNYTVDAPYQKLLMETISKRIMMVDVSDMENGMLKKIYEAHDIKKSIIGMVSHIPSLGEAKSKGFMIYMSVQFKGDRVFDSKLESECAILREKISQIFHTFYMKRVMLFD